MVPKWTFWQRLPSPVDDYSIVFVNWDEFLPLFVFMHIIFLSIIIFFFLFAVQLHHSP